MCIAAWAESAGRDPSNYVPARGVEISHITELLNHEPSDKRVNIRVFVAVTVSSIDPVFLHFVHRRYVAMKNVTALVHGQSDSTYQVAEGLGLIESPTEGPSNAARPVLFRKVNGETLDTIADSSVSFHIDKYMNLEEEHWPAVPFTSVCYGPLVQRDQPYLLSLEIAITGCSYERLIAVSTNGWKTYVYAIEGPSVVNRDIRSLDLTTAPASISSAYERPFVEGISALRLPVQSYDVVTFEDREKRMSVRYFERFSANIRRECVGRRIRVAQSEFSINSWHADEDDFLIEMVMAHPNA